MVQLVSMFFVTRKKNSDRKIGRFCKYEVNRLGLFQLAD